MSTYELQDFLLFSPSVYEAFLALYVSDFQSVAYIANVVALCLLIGIYQPQTPRLLGVLSAVCCAWLAWRFYIIDYSSLNWSAIYMGAALLLVIPLLINASFFKSQGEQEFDKTLCIIALGYLILLRPVIIFTVTEQWQVTPLGLLPGPTLLLITATILCFHQVNKILFLLIPVLLTLIETVTLYLVENPMWQELPIMTALFMLLVGSQKHLYSRRRLVHRRS